MLLCAVFSDGQIMFKQIQSAIFLAIIALLTSACGAGLLSTQDFDQPYYFAIDKDATIYDTDENIEILKVVQKYRDAIASRDIETLKSLVSKDYYENASTTDDLADDYGNERMDEIFNDYLAQSVKDIRFIIEVKQLTKSGMDYHVDFQYIWNFRYEIAGQSYWQSKNDTNRMTIVREDDAWKIKAGM